MLFNGAELIAIVRTDGLISRCWRVNMTPNSNDLTYTQDTKVFTQMTLVTNLSEILIYFYYFDATNTSSNNNYLTVNNNNNA